MKPRGRLTRQTVQSGIVTEATVTESRIKLGRDFRHHV